MAKKTKPAATQPALVAEAFKPGPAELPATPAKLPTADAVKAMGERMRVHAANLQALLSDAQKLMEEKWPIANPDAPDNLHDHVVTMLDRIEIETEGKPYMVVDGTIEAKIADVLDIAEDLLPGPSQGEWARQIMELPVEPTKPVGMPAKAKRSKAE